MSRQKKVPITQFEEWVMLAVDSLDTGYSPQVRTKLEQALSREISLSWVCSSLRRLEKIGFVASVQRPRPKEMRQGREIKLYMLTPMGVSVIALLRKVRRELVKYKRVA